jgi:redox-regulated HSP33 family molecular chaperone
MGRDEVRRMIEEDPEVTVTCEFCGTTYRYDSIDAEMLFAPVG